MRPVAARFVIVAICSVHLGCTTLNAVDLKSEIERYTHGAAASSAIADGPVVLETVTGQRYEGRIEAVGETSVRVRPADGGPAVTIERADIAWTARRELSWPKSIAAVALVVLGIHAYAQAKLASGIQAAF